MPSAPFSMHATPCITMPLAFLNSSVRPKWGKEEEESGHLYKGQLTTGEWEWARARYCVVRAARRTKGLVASVVRKRAGKRSGHLKIVWLDLRNLLRGQARKHSVLAIEALELIGSPRYTLTTLDASSYKFISRNFKNTLRSIQFSIQIALVCYFKEYCTLQ